jgi:hypothetical protein
LRKILTFSRSAFERALGTFPLFEEPLVSACPSADDSISRKEEELQLAFHPSQDSDSSEPTHTPRSFGDATMRTTVYIDSQSPCIFRGINWSDDHPQDSETSKFSQGTFWSTQQEGELPRQDDNADCQIPSLLICRLPLLTFTAPKLSIMVSD